MNTKNKLFSIADRQQGYFTAQQAEECGFRRSNFHRFLKSGEWMKECRGIYKLGRYPIQDRSELVLWALWSRDRKGMIQGIFSHETALDIYELTDLMPSKMHMTVPKGFRKWRSIPKHLVLHFRTLPKKDIEMHRGYRVTTPLRTLIDVVEDGNLSADQITQGIQEAFKKGLISKREMAEAYKAHPKAVKQITNCIEEQAS